MLIRSRRIWQYLCITWVWEGWDVTASSEKLGTTRCDMEIDHLKTYKWKPQRTEEQSGKFVHQLAKRNSKKC